MAAQSLLGCTTAALLIFTVVSARVLDIGDPRAGTDRAPLKIDRVSFNVPHDGRKILAAAKMATGVAEQTVAGSQPSAVSNSSSGQLQGPAAPVASGNSSPAAAPTAAGKPAAQGPNTTPPPAAANATSAAAAPGKPAAAVATAAAAAPSPAQPAAPANSSGQVSTTVKPEVPGNSKQGSSPAAAAGAPAATAAAAPALAAKPAQPAAAGWLGYLQNPFTGGLQAPPRKDMDTIKQPQDKIQEMTIQELEKEDAPPTSCRWEPQTRGIKWNRGCGNRSLGSSCNGIVLSGPPYCDGKGGSLATIQCLQDGEWGDVKVLC